MHFPDRKVVIGRERLHRRAGEVPVRLWISSKWDRMFASVGFSPGTRPGSVGSEATRTSIDMVPSIATSNFFSRTTSLLNQRGQTGRRSPRRLMPLCSDGSRRRLASSRKKPFGLAEDQIFKEWEVHATPVLDEPQERDPVIRGVRANAVPVVRVEVLPDPVVQDIVAVFRVVPEARPRRRAARWPPARTWDGSRPHRGR